MAGIYLHIPFCTKACHYCNFHFSTTHSLLPQMVQAMQQEIVLRKQVFIEEINTIYFGGGTPSICSSEQLETLLQTIYENTSVAKNAEITIEANPNDITPQRLQQWLQIGINRLSVGIQSFENTDLQWMNRAHNSQQALQCLQEIIAAGYSNYSIDLIYGTPTLTVEQWKNNVQVAIDNKVPHISCYALTVEQNTALEKMIAKNKIQPVSNEQQAQHFELLMHWLPTAGYEHYEISNFCLPNKQSRHNSAYWQGKTYIGIGPSAHSYNGIKRSWNIANNALYIKNIEQKRVIQEAEVLTPIDNINECIMIGLRTQAGINMQTIAQKFGKEKANTIMASAQKYIERQQMMVQLNNLVLTNTGKLIADAIAADLFFSAH